MNHSEQKNTSVLAVALPVALALWTLAVCALPNVCLSITEPLSLWQRLTNLLLPCGIYTLLVAAGPRTGKTSLWMFPLMFFAAFQTVLLYMYGRSVIAVDMFLNLVTTNPDEVGELLGNMTPIIIVVCLLYLPPIIAAIGCCVRHRRMNARPLRMFRRTGLVMTAAGALCFGLSYTSARPYRPLNDLYPLNVAYNVYLAVDRSARTADYHATSAGFSYGATSTRGGEKEIYVIVVGETARAPQWGVLGGDVNTTKAIEGRQGMTAFPRVLSQSNTTHKSVPMLLSDLDAEQFGDSIYSRRGIISAFREAGFRTAFFSNQARNRSFIDFFGEEADTCAFIGEHRNGSAGHAFDHELLPWLDRFMASGGDKQLIVLHTYGSHFSYLDRYPQGSGPFLPDSPLEVSASNRPTLLNAYNNTIDYTARLLAAVMDRLQKAGCHAAMFYTSDHGEDIYDDSRELFLHASPCPSYYQIHVPMIVWISPSLASAFPDMSSALEANRMRQASSSTSFFHTIAHVAGLQAPGHIDPTLSLASPLYKERPPMYLDDHNEAVSLRHCGLLEPDFARLDSLGINY